MQFHLYVPQLRTTFERLVASARAAEAAGFEGIAGMDHLVTPAAEPLPLFEAMVTNTLLAARTERLKVSSLVLCDAFRHPALLARQAVTLDHASGGRFELGLGSGSLTPDFEVFGVEPKEPRQRVQRMRETLEVLTALWAGKTVDYDGEFHHFRGASLLPQPLSKIPLVIGGAGPKTLALVHDFADWWNMDVRHHDKLENGKFEQLREQVGKARVSIQQMVAFIPKGADRKAISDLALRRFGRMNPFIGNGSELIEHFGRLEGRGIERVYVWFCDFAPPETVAAFGAEVIDQLRA